MTAKERAAYIVDRFRRSIIQGRKEDIETLIAYHVEEAEKAAVLAYQLKEKAKQEKRNSKKAHK